MDGLNLMDGLEITDLRTVTPEQVHAAWMTPTAAPGIAPEGGGQ